MNVQTERLENHTIRLTVEVPQERFDKARTAVIKKVSGRINIPGFRKGKVPPSMVVKYVGEAYILEEVMESLGQDVYKEALESSGVEPAAPGSMDDFSPEPEIKFTFTVPLAPEVTLGDYRSFRLEYTDPETTENDVDAELRMLQREFAETTESEGSVEAGDRVTCDLHSFFITEDAEATEGDVDVHDREEEPYVHRHGAVIDLREGEDEPLAPGFTAQMVGAMAGETRTFRITLPADDPKINADAAGRTVEFVVTVQKIEKVTLPVLNDELAAQISQRYGWDTVNETAETTEEPESGEEAQAEAEAGTGDSAETSADSPDETDTAEVAESMPDATRPLNLAELRERVRNAIESRSKDEAREKYANSVLEHVIETSSVVFHEASVEQQIDEMIEDFKERLQQNRLSLDLYLKSTGRSLGDIRADYRPAAERQLRRSLAVREFAQVEGLTVSQDDLNARLQTVFADIGAEAVGQLGLLNNPQFASNLINNLMSQKIEERAVAIGRGEAPELGQAEDGPAQDPSPEATESSTEQ